MLKTRTRIFLKDDDILGQKKAIDGNCFIDLNYVVAYYELPPDEDYPEGATNICLANHDITILMTCNQFELAFEAFRKEQLIGVRFN